LALTAATAFAHPQTSIDATIPPNPAGLQGGVYVWNAVGQTSIWQEANGKPDGGMFADPEGSKILGLQLHNVCYGTFPAACDPAQGCALNCTNVVPGPDCLNCHHGDYLFTYLPWGHFANGQFVDGTAAGCAAADGVFVPKDTLLFGQYDDLTKHNGIPATQCFPAGYGQ
jgi:hypothetical protein